MESPAAEKLKHDIGDMRAEHPKNIARHFGRVGQIVRRKAKEHEEKHGAKGDEGDGSSEAIELRTRLRSSHIVR